MVEPLSMDKVKSHKKVFEDREVHWIFECGCIYKGKSYKVAYRRVCLDHGQPVASEVKQCKECSCSFLVGPTGGSTKYCNQCAADLLKKRNNLTGIRRNEDKRKAKNAVSPGMAALLAKKPKDKKCSNCSQPVAKDNYFLCAACSLNNSEPRENNEFENALSRI